MATLKSLLKTATSDIRTVTTSNQPSKPSPIPRFTTPAIHIHDPQPSNKLFRYLTSPPTKLIPKPPRNNLSIYIYPTPHSPTLQICTSLTQILIPHTTASGNSAFAILHVHIPHVPRFDAYLHPFTEFPTVVLEAPRSPLAVCQCFIALRTCGILLPPGNFVPLVARGCLFQRFHTFRWVGGNNLSVHHAIHELVRAVNNGVLEECLSCWDRDKYVVQLGNIRKWALLHPANRGSVMDRLGGDSLMGNAHLPGIGQHLKMDVVTSSSVLFPSSNKMRNNKSMIRVTNPRERWHFLTFLDVLSPTSSISSLAMQSLELCQQLSANCHTYVLTCLDGRERGFQICHWDGMDCLPVVVEMEIVEEGDGSRSIAAMRLVDDMSVRASFKTLPRAKIGKVVCWRACCGLVERLGLLVCGVPGDQLAVADCSVWFVGLI